MSDEPMPERRFLGVVEVDSGTLLIGDPTYCLPRAEDRKPGIDYQAVIDAPLRLGAATREAARTAARAVRRRRHVPGVRGALRGRRGRARHDLSGRALAEVLHAFVQQRCPGHVFHYEEARVALERTGVDVRGTGSVTRAALAATTDLFEHIPEKRGYWRWK